MSNCKHNDTTPFLLDRIMIRSPLDPVLSLTLETKLEDFRFSLLI